MAIQKARLRVRDSYNVNWWDVCNNPTYVRNADNTDWIPLDPGNFYMLAPEYSDLWNLIVCDFDIDFDNPCDNQLEPTPGGGACLGDPSDRYAGSGDGTGSNGAAFDSETGWPKGYDLPDSGQRGFGIANDSSQDSGRSIYRPGTSDTYQYAYGAMSGDGTGTWDRPTVPLDNFTTPPSTVNEVVASITKCVPIYYSNSSGKSSIDVYCATSNLAGERVATTCGAAYGSGVLWVCCEGKILIRVTNPDSDNSVDVSIGEPENVPGEDKIVSEEEGGGTIIDMGEDIGTPLVPYPCGATVQLRGSLASSYTHFCGTESGWRGISFTQPLVPGMVMDVIYEGRLIATTLNSSNDDYLAFWFEFNSSTLITVRIRGTFLANWEYTFYCDWIEGEGNGSEQLPAECPTLFYSLGAAHHIAFYEFAVLPDPSIVVIDFRPFNSSAVLSIYDRNGTLLDSHGNGTDHRFMIRKSQQQHGDSRDLLRIRVECDVGEYYEYEVFCPIETLQIEVPDVVKPFDPTKAMP